MVPVEAICQIALREYAIYGLLNVALPGNNRFVGSHEEPLAVVKGLAQASFGPHQKQGSRYVVK